MHTTLRTQSTSWQSKVRRLLSLLALGMLFAGAALPSSAEAQVGTYGMAYSGSIGTTRELWSPSFTTGLPVNCMVSVTALFDLNGASPTSSTSNTWGMFQVNGTPDYMETGNGAQAAYAQPTDYTQYWRATQTAFVQLPALSSIKFGCHTESTGGFAQARYMSCDIVYSCQ